jgi:hypothetical protein
MARRWRAVPVAAILPSFTCLGYALAAALNYSLFGLTLAPVKSRAYTVPIREGFDWDSRFGPYRAFLPVL